MLNLCSISFCYTSEMAKIVSSTRDEEFLPAALEILESPPSPLGRILMFTIIGFFGILILWSWASKVDVVIVGQGRVVPSGYVKTVQAFETGVVTKIHVADGQYVNAGQVLVELDPTETTASVDSLKSQLADFELNLAVSMALLSADPLTLFIPPEGANEGRILSAKLQLKEMHSTHLAELQELDAEKSRIEAQLKSLTIEMQRVSETLPILESRVAAAGTLLARDSIRQDERLSLKQALIELRSSYDTFNQSQLQLKSEMDVISAQKTQAISNFMSYHRAAEREARLHIYELKNQISAESRRNEYRFLKAPVAGFVDQLQTHTVGGVLGAGEIVLNIVPTNNRQEIDAFILNKDIGFINNGDAVEIKLEAFPFTKYGVVDGKVTNISNDAFAHDQLGLVYKVTIIITTPLDVVEKSGIMISPGMNATVEVISEKRRIIDYFISPLLRYKDEAIRER